MNSISVKNIVKNYGGFEAVKGISFEILEGEFFGLLGPNGAGKTTLLGMLSTILSVTSGDAFVNGFDVKKEPDRVRESIGMVFQDSSLDLDLTARENLMLHSELYSMQKDEALKACKRVLEMVELEKFAEKQVKTFSGGMKRRLEIARGLMHTPKILFLDEPTLGLDPQTRRSVWKYVQKLSKNEKITVILTTHYLEEADFLCDRIAIIDQGKVIEIGSPKELKQKIGGEVVTVKTPEPDRLVKLVSNAKVEKHDHEVMFTVKDSAKFVPELAKKADKNNVTLESVEMHKPTLEDVFIALTGHAIRDEKAGSEEMAREIMKRRFGR